MTMQTLYSRTSTGAIQEWTIEIHPENPCYRTVHGQVNGKMQTSEWFHVEATNVGRANERDDYAQVFFVTEALWKKKAASGCFPNIKDVDTKLFVEPMLAKKWEDRKGKVNFPVYTQPKYDGLRAVISKDGAFSRNGKPWLTIPHILKQLEPVFEKYPELILDGELYNHEFHDDFNRICSLVKKTKPSAADLSESEKFTQYYWYDIADSSKKFRERNQLIGMLCAEFDLPAIKPVATFIADDEASLDNHYGWFMEEGYEGQMIRLDTSYEFKRSANLLKRKEFHDEEFQIMDIIQGNGNLTGCCGAMAFVAKSGKSFTASVNGTREFIGEIWKNKDQYIGKYATVKYFNMTPMPDSVPRFPKVIKIRDGVGID